VTQSNSDSPSGGLPSRSRAESLPPDERDRDESVGVRVDGAEDEVRVDVDDVVVSTVPEVMADTPAGMVVPMVLSSDLSSDPSLSFPPDILPFRKGPRC